LLYRLINSSIVHRECIDATLANFFAIARGASSTCSQCARANMMSSCSVLQKPKESGTNQLTMQPRRIHFNPSLRSVPSRLSWAEK
jgi:hypothetical protein